MPAMKLSLPVKVRNLDTLMTLVLLKATTMPNVDSSSSRLILKTITEASCLMWAPIQSTARPISPFFHATLAPKTHHQAWLLGPLNWVL